MGTPAAIIPTLVPVPDATLDGRYMIEMESGRLLAARPIAETAVVIDPHSYPSVYGLLRCLMPPGLLETVLGDLRDPHAL